MKVKYLLSTASYILLTRYNACTWQNFLLESAFMKILSAVLLKSILKVLLRRLRIDAYSEVQVVKKKFDQKYNFVTRKRGAGMKKEDNTQTHENRDQINRQD